MDELISIITPVYNAQAFVRETMISVLNQTYQNWELILVDDCSKDDSIERIRAFIQDNSAIQEKVKLIALEKNVGAAEARNIGIRTAQGRYVAFLDADDLWQPSKLSEQIDFMKEKHAAFSYHSYEFADENANGTGRVVHALPEMIYSKALTRTIIFTSTVMFDLEKIDRQKIMMPHCPSEDTALWWQLLRWGYTAYGLDKNLTLYRRPAKSLSSDKGEAVRRIWYLYRQREHLSILKSAVCFFGWAVRATIRRL